MNILSNKIKVGKKFVPVLRRQYERQTRHPVDFFAVFLLKPKMIELLRMSWEEYVLGTGKNTNADRQLGTSVMESPYSLE